MSRYHSRWLEVSTLYEMGIGFFLDPDNSWHNETPEAIAFCQKGKIPRNARNIGVLHSDDPCAYIAKVLKKFGRKTRECKQRTRPDKTRYREYSIKSMDSLSQAAYDCVEQRISSYVSEFVFDWKKIVKNSRVKTAEASTQTEVQSAHLPPDNYIETRVEVCVPPVKTEDLCAQGANPLEGLIEALALCESPADLAATTEGYSKEIVEDAIALADSQPRRRQLGNWYRQMSRELVSVGQELAQSGEGPEEVFTDCEVLRSVASWREIPFPQDRLDAAWALLTEDEQHRLLSLHAEQEQQPVERSWGISRSQAEVWGATFEWVRGGIVRVMYAAAEYLRLSNGQYVNYSDLRAVGV